VYFLFFKPQICHRLLCTCCGCQGQLIDASIVPVPVQRNTREENRNIKQGEVPEEWQEQTHKLQQKDTDARWVKKNGRSHYG
jgi:hypothetical protein